MADDAYDLARFLEAQDRQYDSALEELRRGYKRSHWIWFVLPQLRGLGRSRAAHFYGLEGAREALAYWQHPVLGARLRECIEAMLAVEAKSAAEILGSLDALKFRSCLTLFREAVPAEPLFQAALDCYYGGQPDPLTLSLLGERAGEA